MTYDLGLNPEDTNLFRLLKENERKDKKAYLKRIMPLIRDDELERFL